MTDEQTNQQDKQDQPNGNAPDKSGQDKADQRQEHTIPKSRFDEVNEKRKAAEAELQSVAESLKEDVPEEFRDLIPDLPPGQLIKWLRGAQAKGLFNPKSAESLDTKRPDQKKTMDLSNMTPLQMREAGYGK